MSRVRLTAEQITTLADYSDGSDCSIKYEGTFKWMERGVVDSIVRWVEVKRAEDDEQVRIFESGQIERIEPKVKEMTEEEMTEEEAREIVAIALSGAVPQGEQAGYAFDAEYEEALSVLYPIDDEGAEVKK